jgi:hypothetical protein
MKSLMIHLQTPHERNLPTDLHQGFVCVPHSPPTLDRKYNLAEGKDDSSDNDAYYTSSLEKYRKGYPPLYNEYQEERGTQDNRHEKFRDLTADRTRFEGHQEVRRRVGLNLQTEDQDHLECLLRSIRSLNIEIEESSHEIDQLRAQCQEQGIIDLDDSYIDNACEDSEDSTSLPPPSLPTPTRPSPPLAGLPLIANTLSTPLDNAPQNHITSWLFDKLTASFTTPEVWNGAPRSPQTQCLVEQANGVVKSKLRAWKMDHGSTEWKDGLLEVTLAMNTQIHSTIGCAPAELLFREQSSHINWLNSQAQKDLSIGVEQEDKTQAPILESELGPEAIIDPRLLQPKLNYEPSSGPKLNSELGVQAPSQTRA